MQSVISSVRCTLLKYYLVIVKFVRFFFRYFFNSFCRVISLLRYLVRSFVCSFVMLFFRVFVVVGVRVVVDTQEYHRTLLRPTIDVDQVTCALLGVSLPEHVVLEGLVLFKHVFELVCRHRLALRYRRQLYATPRHPYLFRLWFAFAG